MSRRVAAAPRTPVCVCGARLRWVRYTPKDAAVSTLPLDLLAARPGTPAHRTANYAVPLGGNRARQLDPFHPLDESLEWGPFNIHYATCPQHVTPEQLAAMSQQNRRTR